MNTPIEIPSLYPHQSDLLGRVRHSLVNHRATIACMPPGGGKTRLAKAILGTYANRERVDGQSGNAVMCVHRRGLVDNIDGSLSDSPALPHGVIMSGRETHGGQRVQVASIDTLLSWFCEGGKYASTQMIWSKGSSPIGFFDLLSKFLPPRHARLHVVVTFDNRFHQRLPVAD